MVSAPHPSACNVAKLDRDVLNICQRRPVSNSPYRSFESITQDDLAQLAQIALTDFADLF